MGNVIQFPGQGGKWGDIKGTLTDQADLQSALAEKADASALANYAGKSDLDRIENNWLISEFRRLAETTQEREDYPFGWIDNLDNESTIESGTYSYTEGYVSARMTITDILLNHDCSALSPFYKNTPSGSISSDGEKINIFASGGWVLMNKPMSMEARTYPLYLEIDGEIKGGPNIYDNYTLIGFGRYKILTSDGGIYQDTSTRKHTVPITGEHKYLFKRDLSNGLMSMWYDGIEHFVDIPWADGGIVSENDITIMLKSGGSKSIFINNITLGRTLADFQLILKPYSTASPATESKIMFTLEDLTGDIALNVDLRAYATQDDGTTWHQMTLERLTELGTLKDIIGGSTELTGSGVLNKIKIELNGTKQANIHAIANLLKV
ncbi:MAG: hypothetical protein ACLFQX_08210 [Candidatus Kapaibacterium sp.]